MILSEENRLARKATIKAFIFLYTFVSVKQVTIWKKI